MQIIAIITKMFTLVLLSLSLSLSMTVSVVFDGNLKFTEKTVTSKESS